MKKIIWGLIVLMVQVSVINATPTISIESYLKNLIKYDVEYKNLFADSSIFEGQLEAAEAMYSWKLNGSIAKAYQDQTSQGTSLVNDMDNFSTDVNLSRMFKRSGTIFTVGHAYNSSEMSPVPGPPSVETYNTALYMSVVQPLLQNAMGRLNQYPVKKLESAKRLVKLSDDEKSEAYFESQLSLYYDWVLVDLALRTTLEHYNNMQKLHQLVKQQYSNDYITKSDLLRSREAVFKTEDALSNLLSNWNLLYESISRKINNEYQPATNWNELPCSPGNYEILMQASTRDEDLRISKMYKEMLVDSSLDRKNIKEESKTKLNAFIDLRKYERGASQTGILGDLDRTDYTVGLQLEYDLENLDYSGKIKENDEKVKSIRLEWLKSTRDLNLLISKIDNEIEKNTKSMKRYTDIQTWSSERVDREMKRYNLGKIPFRTLVDTQNELLGNKNNTLELKVTGYKLFIAKLSANDQLLKYVKSLNGER